MEAINPCIAGTITPSVLRLFAKSPVVYPKVVLKRQFNPNGAELKKSRNNPEIKPVISPASFPL